MTINRVLVVKDSTNVDSIHYSTESLQMVVVYKGGERYVFTNVPHMVFSHLATSSSVGSDLNAYTGSKKGRKL